MAEVADLHPDQWILMRVTAQTEDRMPARGLILAHSPSRGIISEAVAEHMPARESESHQPLYVFRASSRTPIDEDDPVPPSQAWSTCSWPAWRIARVPTSGDEISFQLEPRYFARRGDEAGGLVGWGTFVLPIAVGDDFVLSVALSLILNGSFIAEPAVHDLQRLGLVPPQAGQSGQRFWLRGLRVATQPLPDIEVRVGSVAEQLGVDGILGHNVLDHFACMRYDISSHRLSLVRKGS